MEIALRHVLVLCLEGEIEIVNDEPVFFKVRDIVKELSKG
jgi:hypothetical protein